MIPNEMKINTSVLTHAGKPPGMATERHIINSLSVLVAEACSFEWSWLVQDVITACGTGCSTKRIRITNWRAISGSSRYTAKQILG